MRTARRRPDHRRIGLRHAIAGAALALCAGVQAQTSPAGSTGGSSSTAAGMAGDPNPYFIGVSQGLTYDSNVFRTPGGPSDVYSTTSLFGGFDQPLGRQRVYGRGTVSLNRYRDDSELNNTSYGLSAGLAFDTIMRLSGNVDVGLDQSLTAPAASTAEQPEQRRNLARSQRIDGRVRWGGVSVFTLEGAAGYGNVDYADEAYAGSESSTRTASITGFYRPGARLRLGLGLRGEDTDQPQALRDPFTGVTQGNEIRGRSIDVLADYAYSAILGFNGRISRTRQSNSNAVLEDDDFSGWTGRLGASYRATGRLTANLSLARNVGVGAGTITGYNVTFPTTPTTPDGSPGTPTLTPTTSLYENNRVTNSVDVGANYSVTAKISAAARLGYARSTVASTSTSQAFGDVRDVLRSASLGVDYEVTRLASLGCNYSYESRKVTGGVTFSTNASVVGCVGRFTWR